MAIQRVFVSVVLSALLVQCVWSADTPADSVDKVDKAPAVLSPNTPTTTGGEMSLLPHNVMQFVTQGGVVAVGIIILAGLAALTMPLFGIKYCQILGNCNDNYGYSNSVYQNDPSLYGSYAQSTYPSSNTYQKRSVDYVGPVLHMLKTAYDKYGQNTLAAMNKKTS